MSVTTNTLARELEEMEDQRDVLDARLAMIMTMGEETFPWSLVKRLSDGEPPVRVWRENRGMSLEELADKLGVDENHLRVVDAGMSEPGLKLAVGIARALRVDLGDLVPPSQD